MTLGEKLKEARIKKGLFQMDIAKKIGNDCKPTNVSNWELDVSKPDYKTLKKLCEILDLDSNYLLDIQREINIFKEFEDKDLYLYNLITTMFTDDTGKEILKVLEDLPESKKKQVLEYAIFIKNKEG